MDTHVDNDCLNIGLLEKGEKDMDHQDRAVKLVCCYAHEDEELQEELKRHLSTLQRQHLIDVWYDRNIDVGAPWDQEIKKALNEAQIILLLISSHFIGSDYCCNTEMKLALERYELGEAKVIFVILRPCNWKNISVGNIQLGSLQALPKNAKPVTTWENHDEAWKEVTKGIERMVNELLRKPPVTVSYDSLVSTARSQPRISRRAVVVGGGLTVMGVGSIAWSMRSQLYSLITATSGTPSSVSKSSVENTLYTYSGHHQTVENIAWSPDGQYIASAGENHEVHIWDATPPFGALRFRYSQHISPVRHVAWSPNDNGERIASASVDGAIHVWESTTGKRLSLYSGHGTSSVYRLAWSPRGDRIASVGQDTMVHVWDPATGNSIRIYRGHTTALWGIAWSPDGQYIVSSSENYDSHRVRMWDTATGNTVSTYDRHEGSVWRVTWSPAGNRILTSSADKTVHVLEVSLSQAAINEQPLLIYPDHHASIWDAEWSPDGKRVASSSTKGIVNVWDPTNGNTIFTYKGHQSDETVTSVAWNPVNGNQLASASHDQTVHIWHL